MKECEFYLEVSKDFDVGCDVTDLKFRRHSSSLVEDMLEGGRNSQLRGE